VIVPALRAKTAREFTGDEKPLAEQEKSPEQFHQGFHRANNLRAGIPASA